jgi:hypothetical protein
MARRPEGVFLILAGSIAALLTLPFFSSPCFAGTDLSVVWHDNHNLAPSSFEVMKRELESIFSDVGVSVSVHRGEVGRYTRYSSPHIHEINVVLQPHYAGRWAIHADAMGAAVGGYAYVFFPRIQSALGLTGKQDFKRNLRAKNLLGRALGRVVAHEIVHVIAPGYPHQSEGLMCASFSRRELRRHHLYLDPMSAAVFVNRLRGESSYEIASTAPSAPQEGVDVPTVVIAEKKKNPEPNK